LDSHAAVHFDSGNSDTGWHDGEGEGMGDIKIKFSPRYHCLCFIFNFKSLSVIVKATSLHASLS